VYTTTVRATGGDARAMFTYSCNPRLASPALTHAMMRLEYVYASHLTWYGQESSRAIPLMPARSCFTSPRNYCPHF